MKRNDIDMLSGSLWRNALRFAIPIMLTTLLQLLFHSADLIVVGNFAGSSSLAAVGATGSVSGLIVSLFMGLSVGVSVVVAHALGAQDKKAVQEAVHTAVPVALICGGVLTVAGIFLARPVLVWMGTPAEVLGKATLYMRIYFCGIIAIMVYNFGASILRAAGDSKSPLVFLAISGGLNVVLNVIFVAAFSMDVAGVALATALTNGLSAVLVVIALCKRQDSCRLVLRKMQVKRAPLLEILRIGIPSGIQTSLFSFANTIIQTSVNGLGAAVMSGNAAASNVETFVQIGNTAFIQVAVNFTGQNMGACQYRRIGKILRTCILMAVGFELVLGLAAFLLREPLLRLYIRDSADAVLQGAMRMRLMSLLYPFAAMMDITASTLRGMGKSLFPTIVSVVCICGVRLLWVFTVFQHPAFHSLVGLCCCFPLSWMLAFLVHFLTYRVTVRKILENSI